MCGIIAIRSLTHPVPGEALLAATAALRHRGPDGQRTWLSESGRIGLGHTRLAIMDPEGGGHPIASEDGHRRIVVNGEFYGFDDIRASLEARGHRFRTRSDSEIALHLYEDLGTRCLEHLRGQFAFVLWDEVTQTLFAARDRLGLKPLFYCRVGDVVYLASEAKAILAAGVAARWDAHSVYRLLHACPDEARSLFADIAQLPPGHFLVVAQGALRIMRYWDVPEPNGDSRPALSGDAGLVEQVHDLLLESVRLRMRADVPVGCLLSGGLDSSSILGMAAKCSEGPITAFTVGFDHERFDESGSAAEAAVFAGARHHVVRVPDHAIAASFADAVWHAEMVQYNAHGTARFLLARDVSRSGYKSVLAGEGADEVFMGYQFTRAVTRAAATMGWRRRLSLVLRLLRPSSRRYPGLRSTSPWLGRLVSLLDLSPALLERLDGGLGALRSLMSDEFLRRHSGYDLYREYYRECERNASISSWHPAHRLTYLWLHSLFVNYHLAADRLDMAHGVEVRLPFLDHVLIERMQQVPLAALAGHTREKHLLRTAVRPYIPDSVHDRSKRPFWAPPTAASGLNPLHDLVQDTLRGSAAGSLPFFERTRILSLLDSLPRRDAREHAAIDSLLLVLTSLAVLQERYAPANDDG